MSVKFLFTVTNRDTPKKPHLLLLDQNERTGRINWFYFAIVGKFVPRDAKPLAYGVAIYAAGGSEFDLLYDGNSYGVLTLRNKNLRTLSTGDSGEFVSSLGSGYDVRFNERA